MTEHYVVREFDKANGKQIFVEHINEKDKFDGVSSAVRYLSKKGKFICITCGEFY